MNTKEAFSRTTEPFEDDRPVRAVVIGGSMAGMLAARVLSDHFDQVTIIERDQFPEGPAGRAGVLRARHVHVLLQGGQAIIERDEVLEGPISRAGTPQARHVHVLLRRGQMIIESLFPGLCDELIADGALRIDAGSDIAWLTSQGWGVNFQSDVYGISMSRDLLDWKVRHRVAALPNVEFMTGCEVTELIHDDRQGAICGLSFRRRPSADVALGEEQWMIAALVVEASGRASKLPKWLEAIGYDAPPATRIDAHLGYASRIYRIPAEFKASWKGIYLQSAPPHRKRSGLLFPIEDNRWLVTMLGADYDYAPTDEAGFLEFARSLRSTMIYEAIKDAEPLTPISGHRGTDNRRRHYESLKRWPEQLLALGDGACAFNPVYGQGMTTAALGAELLGSCLREVGVKKGLAREFQRRLSKLMDGPWMLSTGEDSRYPRAEGGKQDAMTRFMHRYVDQVFALSTRDAGVRLRFFEVQGMVKPAMALFQLSLFIRVIGGMIRDWFGQTSVGSAKSTRPKQVIGMRERTSPSKF